MAITVTKIGTDLNSDADATSYATASFSFVEGRHYFLLYHASTATNGDLATPTVSGSTSGTWTLTTAISFNTVATALNRAAGARYLASGTFSEAITLDFGAANDQLGCRAIMVELTGMRTTSTVVQTDTGRGDAGTSVDSAVTLGAFADAVNNLCLMWFGKDTNTTAIEAGGLTELREITGATPAHSLHVYYQIGQNLTPSATWAGAADWGGSAVEIAAAAGTAALTGTAVNNITEADIVTGGKTILLTLTNDTWVTAGATFDAQRQNIINGCDSAQAEATGWDAEVKAKMAVTDVARTSNTLVTITLPAEAAYNITAMETITVTIPSTAVALGAAIVASPTFTVVTVGGGVAATSTTLRQGRRRRR